MEKTSFPLLAVICGALAVSMPSGGAVPGAEYGVCAHLHRVRDPQELVEECRWIAATGIKSVRFDLEWRRVQKERGAPFDFSHYDQVVAEAESFGLRVLPILFDVPKWADPVWEHLDDWSRFVAAVVEHFGPSFPEIEIWNEENLRAFWKHEPDPGRYVQALAAAYSAAKAANPDVRVLYGGTAGVPLQFIRKTYEAGAAPWFDAMNVHPYSHPAQPEGNLDGVLESLRALMAEFGDANKPVVITEHGWPTHKAKLSGLNVLRPALAAAMPGKKNWRLVYAATETDSDGGPPRSIAAAIEEAMPPGTTVEACFGARLLERLNAGDVDAVVYPFDETYPSDTAAAVRDWVLGGGVLADLGGMPMWVPCTEASPGVFVRGTQEERSALRDSLRIAVSAWWMDETLPRDKARAFPTDVAKAAGYLGDPAGEYVNRYQTAAKLRPGDEFEPLLVTKDSRGRDAVAASIVRLDPAGGCVIVSGVCRIGAAGSAGEEGQGRYLARAMAIAFAEGVDEYFWYEFRGREIDPLYSEHHFGLTHQNFTPKPAWGVYRNFLLARPAGSVQLPGPWHDDARRVFFPQWTRPDGSGAGMVWKLGATDKTTLRFSGSEMLFRDYTGRKLSPERNDRGEWVLPVGENPIFFEGGTLAAPEAWTGRR